jgi:hypothetical protein
MHFHGTSAWRPHEYYQEQYNGKVSIHVAQCLNYLRATGLKVCLLLNFGTPKVQIRRLVNSLKSVFICVHLWLL